MGKKADELHDDFRSAMGELDKTRKEFLAARDLEQLKSAYGRYKTARVNFDKAVDEFMERFKARIAKSD